MFHDPTRARLANGRPCLQGLQVALPALRAEPLPLGWRVSVWLPAGGGAFRESHLDLPYLEALRELLLEYALDPEGVLQEHFHYSPPGPKAPPPPASPALLLSDLGL